MAGTKIWLQCTARISMFTEIEAVGYLRKTIRVEVLWMSLMLRRSMEKVKWCACGGIARWVEVVVWLSTGSRNKTRSRSTEPKKPRCWKQRYLARNKKGIHNLICVKKKCSGKYCQIIFKQMIMNFYIDYAIWTTHIF